AEDGIRDFHVTGVQTCALPIFVGVAVSGTKGVAVEVNSETDFVAKNEQFQGFVSNVAQVALNLGSDDVEALAAAEFPGGGTVQRSEERRVGKGCGARWSASPSA